jgi:nucleoside-diphosphate-sugar epimerase
VLDAGTMAQALRARQVPVPQALVRAVVAAAWRLRLIPMDPGWVDLGLMAPVMSIARARRELDWGPSVDVRDALADVVRAMGSGRGGDTAVLRPRAAAGGRVVEVLRAVAGSGRR